MDIKKEKEKLLNEMASIREIKGSLCKRQFQIRKRLKELSEY